MCRTKVRGNLTFPLPLTFLSFFTTYYYNLSFGLEASWPETFLLYYILYVVVASENWRNKPLHCPLECSVYSSTTTISLKQASSLSCEEKNLGCGNNPSVFDQNLLRIENSLFTQRERGHSVYVLRWERLNQGCVFWEKGLIKRPHSYPEARLKWKWCQSTRLSLSFDFAETDFSFVSFNKKRSEIVCNLNCYEITSFMYYLLQIKSKWTAHKSVSNYYVPATKTINLPSVQNGSEDRYLWKGTLSSSKKNFNMVPMNNVQSLVVLA